MQEKVPLPIEDQYLLSNKETSYSSAWVGAWKGTSITRESIPKKVRQSHHKGPSELRSSASLRSHACFEKLCKFEVLQLREEL